VEKRKDILRIKVEEFDVQVTVHRDIFLYKNKVDALITQIYFGIKFNVFRTVPLSIIRSLALLMMDRVTVRNM